MTALTREAPRTVLHKVDPCGSCGAREASVCRGVGDEFLDRLASIVASRTLDPHELIVAEGDAATSYFNITDGSAKVYKLLPDGRQQIVGFLFTGDFVGLAVRDTYAYTVEAMTRLKLCRFGRGDLERLLGEFPHMEHLLRQMASDELAVAQEQMLALGRKTARERVAGFLIQLSRRAERLGQAPNPVQLPMTRADIADYLGLTLETVSRTLTLLKSAGLIAVDRQTVYVSRKADLIEIAEGEA